MRRWPPLLWVLLALLLLPALALGLSTGDNEAAAASPLSACPAGPPFLIAEVYGGLNNQRWGLLIGLLFALQHRLRYVLPLHLDLDALGTACPTFQRRHPVAFLYDVDHLSREAALMGLRVVNDWDNGTYGACCAAALKNRYLPSGQGLCVDARHTFKEMRKHLAVTLQFPLFADSPFRLRGRLSPHLFFLVNEPFQALRRTLRPSAALRRVIANLTRQMRAAAGAAPYAVVHARLETDFKDMENHWRGYRAMTEAELTRRLTGRFGLAPGSRLHVCSGTPKAQLRVLCAAFECFQTRDLRLPTALLGHCPAHQLPRDLMAFLDFHVALAGAAFYGHLHSSFSVELYADYAAAGRPAFFLNWDGRREW